MARKAGRSIEDDLATANDRSHDYPAPDEITIGNAICGSDIHVGLSNANCASATGGTASQRSGDGGRQTNSRLRRLWSDFFLLVACCEKRLGIFLGI